MQKIPNEMRKIMSDLDIVDALFDEIDDEASDIFGETISMYDPDETDATFEEIMNAFNAKLAELGWSRKIEDFYKIVDNEYIWITIPA